MCPSLGWQHSSQRLVRYAAGSLIRYCSNLEVLPKAMNRLALILIAAIFCVTGCDFRTPPSHSPAKIESDPSLLNKYLGFDLPKSAGNIKIQSISDGGEKSVILIAKFEINNADLQKMVQDFQMVKSDNADATVPAAPLVADKPDIAWWNPPVVPAQFEIKTRYFKSLNGAKQQNDEDHVSLVWVDGVAYVYKSGPY